MGWEGKLCSCQLSFFGHINEKVQQCNFLDNLFIYVH